jgi:hypothetical protein
MVGEATSIVTPGQFGAVTASALGKGFFGLAFQTASFAALLNFLETQGSVSVLSSPRIATLNNQKAVHKLVPKATWKGRYRQINEFERMLGENGVKILKFYLHISKREQAKRLRDRIEDPSKNWKFSEADVRERRLWARYQSAFEDALTRCSTPWAPWHVIPADRKWVRDALVARAMVAALEGLRLRYPKPKTDLSTIVIR